MASGPSQTTTNGIPDWLSKAGEDTYAKGLKLYNSTDAIPPSSNQRVAGFAPDQTNAFSMLRKMVTSGGGQYGKLFTQGAGMIADPRTGMSPYTGAVLRPEIANINEAASAARGRVGDQAASAGAYGDARHGILESTVNRDTQRNIGDATARAYDSAFKDAEGRGASLVGASSQGQGDFMSRIQAMLGTGQQQQQNQQSRKDVNFQNYQMKQQSPYDKLAALLSSFTGSPYNRTSTSSTNPGISPLFSLLGSLFGSA